MKNKNHPISRLQSLQREFERTLPSRRFFNADNRKAIQQYTDIMASIGTNIEMADRALPKAFIATLAAANQLNMDLAQHVNQELPKGEKFSRGTLMTLSLIFARAVEPQLFDMPNKSQPNISNICASYAAGIAGRLARIRLSHDLPHIVLLGSAGKVRDERLETEDLIKYAAQDIMTTAGILRLRGEMESDRKYDLERATKMQWAELKAAYVI